MRKPQPASQVSVKQTIDSELDALRGAIDAVDREILERLNERARLVRDVGELKRQAGAGVYSSARERDLVASLERENPGPFPNEALGPVFREVVSATRSLEARLRVAFLGPEGTFSHLAVREKFGAACEACPSPTLADVFDFVQRGKADLGVVPLENTTQGVVTETLDTLARLEIPICGEVRLRISQNLMSRSGLLEGIRRVASHPQPLAQCRSWLDRHLPGVERIEVASTVAAARLAAGEADLAAIGPEIAAEVTGLALVERSIEDRPDNTTRFLVIGGEAPAPSSRDQTLVVYTVRKTQAGALHRLLAPFSRHGVNLSSIHSRPIQGAPWEYLFFFEVDGHQQAASVAKALSEAEAVAHSTRCLGSFPSSVSPVESIR